MKTIEWRDDNVARYLDRLGRKKGTDSSTFLQARRSCELFQDFLDGGDLREVTPLVVEDFLLALRDDGFAFSTVNSRYKRILRLYDVLVNKYELPEYGPNPCDPISPRELIDTTDENGDVRKYVTEAEKDAMIEELSEYEYYVRNRAIIETLWQTGMRQGELRNAKLDNLNRDGRSIRIYASKTDDWRTVHYRPALDSALDLWLDVERNTHPESEYLFVAAHSERLESAGIKEIVRKAAKPINEKIGETQNGQTRWRISAHSLRHGHAVHALKQGVDVRSVQKQLGHADISTTMRYLDLIEDDVKMAYKAF